MRRALALIALATLVLPASAAADLHITRVDSSKYPTVDVTVVTSSPSAKPPLIREGGQPVTGLDAHNLGRDANVVLAIDRSRSMKGAALADASHAARTFLGHKPQATRVEIVAFGKRATDLTGFATSTIDADNALATIEVDANQGTALWDAVVLASRNLRAADTGGRVLVVLTDGADTTSVAKEATAIDYARQAGVAVYPIGIESDQFSPAALKRLAAATGGTYYAASSTASLATVYSKIQHQLRLTWRVDYATAARPGDSPMVDASIPGLGADQRRLIVSGTAPQPVPPSTLVPTQAYDHGVGALAIAVIVGLVTLLAIGLLLTAPRAKRLQRRISPHVGTPQTRAKREKRDRLAAASGILNATEAAFRRFSAWGRMERLLVRADLPLRTVELFYVCVLCAFVPAFLFAFAGSSTFFLVLTLAGGYMAPIAFVWFKARKRLSAIDEALPDLLITLAASLKAGHSFRQGIQAATEEGDTPLTKELKRVLTETSLGRPMDDALAEMADRVGSKDLGFVITAVTIQRQVGGSLAGIFDLVADTIRQRQQFHRKIKGLTAMGRMSGYVLVGLPFGLAALLTLINPTYMSPLWNTDTGHLLIEIGFGMIGTGGFLLKRIVSFKG